MLTLITALCNVLCDALTWLEKQEVKEAKRCIHSLENKIAFLDKARAKMVKEKETIEAEYFETK